MIDERELAEDRVLRRYWYAVAFSKLLAVGPVAANILGRDIVVARLDGETIATLDRCPHRGAALSPGAVVARPAGECLQCPYHGLHFDRQGRAVYLPSRPEERLASRLDLELLPCLERHGIVWASLDSEPVGEPPDWSAFDVPAYARFQLGPEAWPSMAARIVENFNDLAHFATVHAATFGDAGNPEVPIDTIAVASDAATIGHSLIMHQLDRVTLDGPLVPIDVEYAYVHTMPFSTELRIMFDADRIEWIQMSATPTGPASAMVFQQNVRNFDVEGNIDAWCDFQAAVNDEDRQLLQTVQPVRIALDGSGAPEVAMSIDAFTIAYRRVWRDLLACD